MKTPATAQILMASKNIPHRKGALARMAGHPNGNLQVKSLTLALQKKKKSPRLFPFSKHNLGSGLTHKATGHSVWMRTESESFLGLCEKM